MGGAGPTEPQAAVRGHLLADGGPFFPSPVDREHIRPNVGSAVPETARDVARVLAATTEVFFTP